MEDLEEKLQAKLEQELEDYKAKVKERGVDYAIDRAYEITAKQEIIDSLLYDNNLSKTQINALLKEKNVLDICYDDWLKFDGNMREHINYSVDKSLNFIVSDYRKEHLKNKKDAR